MQPRVLSVNAGRLERVPGVRRPSGIRKHPVDRIDVRDPGPKPGPDNRGEGSGVVGDRIGNGRHHGGDTHAVLAVAREELDWWSRELARELGDGMFGENLTTLGVEVDDARLGEQWRVGAALLQVSGPRTPCATFAAHMGEERWLRRFTARARVGAYLSVVEAGVIEPGDPIEVVERPGHDITVTTCFLAVMGDRDLAAEVVAAEVLPPAEQQRLASRQRR